MDHHHLPDIPKDVEMSGTQATVDGSAQPSIDPVVEELRSILHDGCDSVHSLLEAWIQREVEKRIPRNLSPVKEQEDISQRGKSLLGQYGGSMGSDPNHGPDQEIRQEMRNLADQMKILSLRLDKTSSEGGQTTSRKEAELKLQLSLQQETNEKLREKISSLRTVLIKTQPRVIDGDVSQQFLQLRHSINHLVRSTFENDFAESRPNPSNENKTWFGPFRTGKPPMRYLANRIRSMIFDNIYTEIFSKPYYASVDDEPLEKIETYFLENMTNGNLSLKDFVDWRSASIKCTQALHQKNQPESYSGDSKDHPSDLPPFVYDTADALWNFFRPLKLKKGRSEQRGRELLQKSCEDAYRLNELMRRARDLFTVVWSENVPGLEISALVDEEFSERDSHSPNGKIAYWTFGALIKRPEENPKTLLVIEKGLMVTHKSQ